MAVIRSWVFEQQLVTSTVEAATINHPLSTNETWLLGEAGGCSGSQRLGVLSLSYLLAAHHEDALFIVLHIPLLSAQ